MYKYRYGQIHVRDTGYRLGFVYINIHIHIHIHIHMYAHICVLMCVSYDFKAQKSRNGHGVVGLPRFMRALGLQRTCCFVKALVTACPKTAAFCGFKLSLIQSVFQDHLFRGSSGFVSNTFGKTFWVQTRKFEV